jgi:subfamily B ATP-binding cassette protein MsbA
LKTFFRILSFAYPLERFIIPFFIFSVLSTFFGLLNFSLLIPLLDVLFSKEDTTQKILKEPAFQWSIQYGIDWFYYYFGQIVVRTGKMGALQFVCVVIVSSVFLTNLFHYLAMRVRERLKNIAIRNIRRDLFARITSMHIGYFSNQRKGDLMSRMTADVTEVETMLRQSLDVLLKEPLLLIGLFTALFMISAQLTFFTLLIVPISGILIGTISRRLRKNTQKSQESVGRLANILDESITAIRVVKGFNADKYVQEKFSIENNNYVRLLNSIARTRELASPFSEVSGVFIVALILLYGGSLVFAANPTLNASQFVGYVLLFSQVLSPAKAIANGISNIQRGLTAGERIFQILDTPADITDAPQAQKLTSFEQSIEFRNVSFKYENNWVLKNVSFSIQKGQKVALVGETGSGKSTLADLVPRFYDVQEGAVLIDNIDIKTLEQKSLRSLMGIVTQEALLFNDTIYQNIAFSTENPTTEDIERAASIANAHDFILKTESGYQTNIGDRGMKLSGGQRQRLTIARAILKNPPILILDEATSALDTESEKLVQDALHKLMENRTSLVIAHRLSTIQDADKIIVLRQGEIAEVGTHESLLAIENGYYRTLSTMQASTLSVE